MHSSRNEVIRYGNRDEVHHQATNPSQALSEPRWRSVVVTHDLPVILHNAFRAPDGDTAVIMINISGKTQQGRLNWHGTDTDVSLKPWELRLVEL